MKPFTLLFALSLQVPGLVWAAQPTTGPTVFAVSQPAEACWQDLAFLATVPASRMANQGDGAVLVLDEAAEITREVEDYFRRLKPQGICHVGAKPLATADQFGKNRQLSCASAVEASILIANAVWTKSPRVVACREDDYASALMASTLAARLRVPLLYCGDGGLSPEAQAAVKRLKATELLFVGKAPDGLKATALADAASVLGWLKKQGHKSSYLAVTNVRDRVGTTVRKLSLAAPILAAARDGMVYPVDVGIRWREQFSGKPVKDALPSGIPAGAKPPHAGVIELPEGNVPFVLSHGKSDKDKHLYLDLDGNGAYVGPGEGPLTRSGVVELLGKPRFLAFGEKFGSNCDVSVTTGRVDEVVAPLRKLYAETGIPHYLCIVGFPDAIPQDILPNGQGDMTSDLPYADADDDLFSEISIGRVIAESAAYATLHASRTITYARLLDKEWASRAGQARWETGLSSYFEGMGLNTSAYHDTKDLAWLEKPSEDGKKPGKRALSFGQDSPLTRVAYMSHMAHSWWHGLGETYDYDSNVLLAPTLIESGGCLTCTLDYEPRFHSVIARLFRNGAVSFSGQTRPGIACQEQQRAEFWNAIILGESIGDAHRRAQNSKASLVLETGQVRGGSDHYQLHIRSLFGDPAFKPHMPARPRTASARTERTKDMVRVHGPAVWNTVQIYVPEDWKKWADKKLFVLRGFGTFPDRRWGAEEFDKEEYYVNAEVTTTQKLESITQKQEMPAPLGWNGKFTEDRNPDGSITYRWRVRLVDFDQKAGTILRKVDRVDFQIK